MYRNEIIEIGSRANVVLRFKHETCINNVIYAANEPYLFLRNVNVGINYTNTDKTSTTNKTVLGNSDIKPRSISISGFPFSKKTVALLAKYREVSDYTKTTFETSKSYEKDPGEVFLMIQAQEFIIDDNLFVYDDEFNKIEVDLVGERELTGPELEVNKNYMISFSSVMSGSKFELLKPHTPYMSMEIQAVGNKDKIKKECVIYIDKVSLTSSLNFIFLQDSIVNFPLNFHIIDDKNNFIFFEE